MDTQIYPVPEAAKERALIDKAGYEEMYARSIEDNEAFWAEQAQRIDWMKPFTRIKDVSFAKDDLHIRWFYDGTLNVCYNCVDRHLESKGDDVALIWEGDDPGRDLKITVESARRQTRRPHHDLHADDPGGRYLDARLRTHRGRAFRRIRRLFARRTGRPHP
jgi:acetyl-CoA synthetase